MAIPLGQVFMVLFFILSAIAATGAMISLLEVPVAYFSEQWKWSRPAATLLSAWIMGGIGALATLSTSVLSKTLLFGKTLFDLFDYLSSNIFLTVGGIFICLFVGWKLGKQVILDEASNHGVLNNRLMMGVFTFAVRYVAPVAIIIVLLSGLGIIKF